MVIPDPANDRRMAEATARGDRGGLAELYDWYGPYLYDYCHSLLRDLATDATDPAADAAQDVFVAAWVHMGRLRDPERVRPWLYALARAQCLARTADAGVDLPAGPAPQGGEAGFADPAYLAPGAEGSGTRDLTWRALDGLDGRDLEALDLALRHGIGRRGLAAVLGVPEEEVHARVTGARARFEGAVAALLAPGGAEVDFSAATMLSDLPLTAPPSGLRNRVLDAAFDAASDAREPPAGTAHDEYLAGGPGSEPTLASQRAHVAVLAFDGRGFPVQPDARPRTARRWTVLAAAVALAVTAVGAAGGGLLITRDGGESERPADTPVLTSPTSLPSLSGGDSALAPIPAANSPSPTPRVTATPNEAPRERAAHPQSSGKRGRGQTWDSSPEDEQPRLTVTPRRLDLGTGNRVSVVLGAKGGAVMWGSAPSSDALSVSPDSGAIPQGGTRRVTITLDRAWRTGPGREFVRFGAVSGQIETVVVVWS